jgi:hypothetical protein
MIPSARPNNQKALLEAATREERPKQRAVRAAAIAGLDIKALKFGAWKDPNPQRQVDIHATRLTPAHQTGFLEQVRRDPASSQHSMSIFHSDHYANQLRP